MSGTVFIFDVCSDSLAYLMSLVMGRLRAVRAHEGYDGLIQCTSVAFSESVETIPMLEPADIVQQALALPEAERADLALQLVLSLEPEAANGQPALHQSWQDEVVARSAAYRRGELDATDWKDSIQRIRGRLAEAYSDQRTQP